jgi:hypothetical protein
VREQTKYRRQGELNASIQQSSALSSHAVFVSSQNTFGERVINPKTKHITGKLLAELS